MRKILFLIGGKYHRFQSCGQILKSYLEGTGQFTVELTEDVGRLLALEGVDAVTLYTAFGELSEKQEKSFLQFVRRGGGVLAIHGANYSFLDRKGYVEMIGTQFTGHGPVAQFDVELAPDAREILPRMASRFIVVDEFYQIESRTRAALRPLMHGWWQFEKKLLGYVRDYGKGRVFYTALGHDERVFRHPEFQNLIFKGLRYVTKQKERKVRVGLLGYGPAFKMGQHHSGQIAATQGFELAAVCDRDPARLKAAKEEQGKRIATFRDARAMARSGKIDLGIVILPHAYHFEGAKTLLEAGLNVITEKPFAVKVSECDALIALARKKGTMLSIYHNRHWDPEIRTILEVVSSGVVGDLFSIECNMCGFGRPGQAWRSHKPISGGSAYDMGAHQFEKIFQLVPWTDHSGNPVNRKALLYGHFLKRRWHDTTNEDFVRAYVRFDSGLEAQLVVSSLCASPKPLWSILGALGSITVDSWQSPVKVHTRSEDGRILVTEMPQLPAASSEYYRNIGDHLLCGLPLTITPVVGKRPIQCLEGCERAAIENRLIEISLDGPEGAAVKT